MVFFQNYICDSNFVSRDLQDKLKKKLFNSQYKYKALEEEIVQSKHWPPISSSSGLADVFQRLDSAQTIDHDRTSLMSSLADSASETGSIHIENVEYEAAQREVGGPVNDMPTLDSQISLVDDDATLIIDDENGTDNLGYYQDGVLKQGSSVTTKL